MSEQAEDFTPASLDSFVGQGEESPATPIVAQEKSVPDPEPAAAVVDETETPEKVENEVEEPTASETDKNDDENVEARGLLAALKDERQKRQALAAKVAELEAGTAPEPTSVFEDEGKFRDEIRQEIAGAKITTRLELSHNLAVKQHGEDAVNEAFNKFTDLRALYPQVDKDFADSVDPFAFAMDFVEKQAIYDAIKDGTYNQTAADLVKQEAAKLAEEEKAKESVDADVPDSLVAEPSKGSISSSTWNGPTSLDSFVGVETRGN